MVERYGIYWINLDPTVGREMKKTRPCIVLSPNEINRHMIIIGGTGVGKSETQLRLMSSVMARYCAVDFHCWLRHRHSAASARQQSAR